MHPPLIVGVDDPAARRCGRLHTGRQVEFGHKENTPMRTRVPVTLITLVTLSLLAPASAIAQGGGQGRGGGRGQANPNEPVYPAQMTSRVEGGCGSCHNFPAGTKAPTRDQMRAMTPEQIVDILQKPIPAHEGKVQMSDNQRKAL